MSGSPASTPSFQIGVKRDVPVLMRDGARMAADVYRPFAEGQQFPALLAVSPYGKDFDRLPPSPMFRFRETGPIEWFVERGYAFIHIDSRGSGKSEGTFTPLDAQAQTDLYDMIEWVADQPWCNGKVGMAGAGFYGVNQWLAAAKQPPRLACIAPIDAFVDPYRELAYHGGIPSMYNAWWWYDMRARRLLEYPERHFGHDDMAVGIARKLATGSKPNKLHQAGVQALVRARRLARSIKPGKMSTDAVYLTLSNPLDGPMYWIAAAWSKFDKIKTPFYSVASLSSCGLHLRGNLLAFENIAAPKKLWISGRVGPASEWPLIDTPDFNHQPQHELGSAALRDELLRWYDHWLKGVENGIMEEPAVRYWMSGVGEYRTDSAWPPAGVEYHKLFLRGGSAGAVNSLNDGRLSFQEPGSDEGVTKLRYPDAAWNGTPGLGTAVLTPAGVPSRASRIVTFSSEPLGRPMQIAGPISLKLYASSDQPDTDFIVRLCDQAPVRDEEMLSRLGVSAPAAVVSRGWLRASHRRLDTARSKPGRPWHCNDKGEPLEAGSVYEFDIEIWPTAWRFERGHRIRIELAPGDSAYFDGPFCHFYGTKMGTDTYHHNAERPSHLLLPVIEG
jgi:putative CocE/NonD family hydrolase